MTAPMPVSSRTTFAATPPVSRQLIIRADGNHNFAATTILEVRDRQLVAVPHMGSSDAGRFMIGQAGAESDTIFIAWTRGGAEGSAPAEFSVEQSGLVVASISARRRVVADVPAQLNGVESAYILWLSVRSGQLTVKMPPAGAIVSLASIANWVTTSAKHYESRTAGAVS